MDEGTLLELRVEVWKQTVEVQEHFNDLELRTRNLCVTLVGALFGAIGLSEKGAVNIEFLGHALPFSILLTFVALPVIFAFWLMDRGYHRLLVASVEQGRAMEKDLVAVVPELGLTEKIKLGSPIPVLDRKFDSTMRLDTFYYTLAAIASVALLGETVQDARVFAGGIAFVFLLFLCRLLSCPPIDESGSSPSA